MREPAVKIGSLDRQSNDAELLVVGYRGTLRRASPTGEEFLSPPNNDAALTGDIPPAMEMLLEPWLARASDQLEQRVPQAQRVFQAEPIPLGSLLLLLKDRLAGILTQAVAASCLVAEEQLASPVATDLFLEFPLLLPLLRSAVSEWIAAIVTFLERLHRDSRWIAAAQKLAALPPIESISGTSSDAHAGGHSVLRVCFVGGSCLYYKPRPITGEWLWHALLEAVARLDPELRLPAARVLTNDGRFHYGWAESVFPEENSLFQNSGERSNGSSVSTPDYWHAAGAMLCLAQHVKLTDLHLANIVATPWGPAVTDAECLATPNLPGAPAGGNPREDTGITDALESILGTGLLPSRGVTDKPDISGFFGHAAPLSGVKLPGWTVSSNGRYQLTPVPAELAAHPNAPCQTSAIVVLPQLLSGYRHAAELLLSGRETLIGPGARWRAVLEKVHAPRMVIRDTLTYGILLSGSLAPRYLHSWYRRRSAILSGLHTDTSIGLPRSLLRTEASALLRMHVPRLVILPGSRTLANSSGRTIARGFTACTPAQAVVGQLERLSIENIESMHVFALLSAILNGK
jgi:lantibiotic modifying enzyme